MTTQTETERTGQRPRTTRHRLVPSVLVFVLTGATLALVSTGALFTLL